MLRPRLWAQSSLNVSFDGDNLHVTAPGLHFLEGSALNRVKRGDTVVFLSQFTIFSDGQGTIFRRPPPERLVISFALWEERFAVAIPGLTTPPAMPLLTAEQAEAWAVQNLAVSALGLLSDRPFWLQFELRGVAPKDGASVLDATGISLRSIFDRISQKASPNQPSWTRTAGPLRLADLPRIPVRGSRNG
jgi:hypothetical protein